MSKKLTLPRLEAVLESFGQDVANSYVAKLQQSKASGALAQSVQAHVRYEGQEYQVYLSLEDYWRYVEDGRLSGSWPRVDSIIQWIRVKPIVPQPYILPSGRSVTPTENQLAYLIGRKIYEDGIIPKPYLFETLTQERLGLPIALRNAFRDDIIDTLNIEFAF
jgi:hypothetical protein